MSGAATAEPAAAVRGALARADLHRGQAYVDGAWISAASGLTIAVDDPFTGAVIGSVPSLARGECQAAIDAAERAFPAWSRELARTRGAILRRWYDLVMAHQEDLARLITLENGKPIREARAEVAYGAGFIEFYAEEAGRIFGETIPANVPGRRLMVEHEPVGVCAAITPWNFPLAMLTRKAAPAFAAGCTMVAKPASQTPLAALALAVLAEEAGLPRGVLNVITGKASMIGDLLTASPVVRKISFTGSTEIGAQLMQASAAQIKRLSLELGGNAPLLVFDNADLDAALDTAMVAKFRNSGQSCVAANRIYVQRGIYETFLIALTARIARMRFGDGFDEATDIGPLIDLPGVAKVEEHLDEAVAGGGKLLIGGKAAGGRLMPPTLVRDVAADALLTREETFGPLAGVIPFDTIEQGVALANATPFGLAAYMCSSDPATIARVGRDIESGMVGINTGLISTAVVPFGGVKMSGLGREGSRHGLAEYLNMKYLCHAGL
ncbi:NAD-dependent succinate-semialdehyde dehydrogenase [Sphingomonas canadensis]|uniref:NAD-dependent succinate-semialdehyde dehydrogenase n=1 Tax=Sphingomonas canadensis TaxID=1219257 RepID=A0ABW3HCN8_9SPHN|nr:NAD-dependent succinate-semialdehyde dehydrogenase [Sphingomonas canadensis]MCW3837690.1 NAD-dependent succinate-semialdehyde dehydrogenase [Sphingomonas canadensis]